MNVIVKALGRDHVIRPGHVAVPAALRSAARLPQVASPIREFGSNWQTLGSVFSRPNTGVRCRTDCPRGSMAVTHCGFTC